MSASDFYEQVSADYDANEIRADRKYKGAVYEIRGKVKAIEKRIIDETMHLDLDCGAFLSSVTCYFSDAHEKELADISKGDEVTIVGRFGGRCYLEGCRIKRD